MAKQHSNDRDCIVSIETGLCIECGVGHQMGECLDCHGTGYHEADCPTLQADNRCNQ